MNDNLKLLELYGNDYNLKHEHLWKVYFKFIYAMVFVLGIFILHSNELIINIQKHPVIECIFFSGAEFVITIVSTCIVNREYYIVSWMNEQYSFMYEKFDVNRSPQRNSGKNYFQRMSLTTGRVLCVSCSLLGMLCTLIIIIISML